MDTVEKYYNAHNELGVLVSRGFGAGWSTWNAPELAYDKRIVEFFMNYQPSEDDMEKFLHKLGYGHVYMGGYSQLVLEWVPHGQLFCVHEYDGAESIQTPDTMCMMEA